MVWPWPGLVKTYDRHAGSPGGQQACRQRVEGFGRPRKRKLPVGMWFRQSTERSQVGFVRKDELGAANKECFEEQPVGVRGITGVWRLHDT